MSHLTPEVRAILEGKSQSSQPGAETALSQPQQMQAEEPEAHPQGFVFDLVRDGLGRN